MSVENVKAFFQKVAEDERLQEKLKALRERHADKSEPDEEGFSDLVELASAAGFEFTTADARKARLQARKELSDEELGKVAGGAKRQRGRCVGCES